MFPNLCRSSTCRMPVSLSEWRVRIGTYVPRILKYHNLVTYIKQLMFVALLQTLNNGGSKMGPSEEQKMSCTSTSEHQSSTDNCDEQETQTADNTKVLPCKTSKKRKHHHKKRCDASGQSSKVFLSFRCFMTSGASPFLRFMLLVFTAILLVRSGDVEVNPGPDERSTLVPDVSLIEIAKRIPNGKLSELGHNLGVSLGAMRRYRASNTLGGIANWNGTMDMLIDWRENTMEQQKELLRNALVRSSLQHVADRYLPEDSSSKSVTVPRQRSSVETPGFMTQNVFSETQQLDGSYQQPSPSYMQPPHNTASNIYSFSSTHRSFLNEPSNPLSRQLASSQSGKNSEAGLFPMVTQEERKKSPHIDVEGYTSNPPHDSQGTNMSRTLLAIVSSASQQNVFSRLTPEQLYSTSCVSPSEMRTQSATLQSSAPTVSACYDAPQMSSCQTPQYPLNLHEQCMYGTSRSHPPVHKRSASGALVQPTLSPALDSTFSSNASPTPSSLSGNTSSYVPHNPSVPPSNYKYPITESELEKCIADIKDFYSVSLCQIPTSPLDLNSIVELQSIFTNLFMLTEDRNTKKKIPLKYEDLLCVSINGRPAKRIMIQGEAGVGKTTFCAKIAWDWVTGDHYQDFALVAVVPLRDAKNGKTVGQVMKTYLPDDNAVTSEQLDEYIQTNQDKVLIVFDGFDEFGVEMSNGENDIVQILQGGKHTSGRVIVTTRPWKANEIANGINLKKQYAFIRIEGFKRKDVKTYVTKFYREDRSSADTLLEFIEENSLVTETMAPFPIFCSMLCHMWREVERREMIRKLQTFSQLFWEMIVHLEEHYVSKRATSFNDVVLQDDIARIDAHLQKISGVTFKGLTDDKIAFPEEEFKSCIEDVHIALKVGLLTIERRTYNRAHGAARKLARPTATISFPHKLFQEYTAAFHFRDLFHSNKVEYDRIMKSIILPKPIKYKYLLYFTGSFDKDICRDILKRMIKQKFALDFIVEIAFEGQSEEVANIIEEMQHDDHRALIIKKGTSGHVISGYMFALKHLESICLEGIPHSKILARNLAEKICSLQSLRKMELVGCKVPVSFSEILFRHSLDIVVETFLLDRVMVTKQSAIYLAKCICSFPHLKQFYMEHHREGLPDEFFSTLQLDASQLKLESLEMHLMEIGESASEMLGASICVMPCLKNVKLSICLADGFCSAIKEGVSTLKIKQMHLMAATFDSCHLSTIALMPDLTSLTLFKVFDTEISDRTHTEMNFSDPPLHSCTSLTGINVDCDSFISLHRIGLVKRFPCIQKMCLAFKRGQTPLPQELSHSVTMPDLTDLTLRGYCLPDHHGAHLAMLSLEPFPNLINLSLVNIIIGNDNCTTILDSLRNNVTLKTISIMACDTDTGLDPLCDKINAEGKMMMTVQHGVSKLESLPELFKQI